MHASSGKLDGPASDLGGVVAQSNGCARDKQLSLYHQDIIPETLYVAVSAHR
jgi:hypothetical protein